MDEYYGGYKEGNEMATRLIIDGNSVYEIDEEYKATKRNGLGGDGTEKRRSEAGREGNGNENDRERSKEKPGGCVRPEFM